MCAVSLIHFFPPLFFIAGIIIILYIYKYVFFFLYLFLLVFTAGIFAEPFLPYRLFPRPPYFIPISQTKKKNTHKKKRRKRPASLHRGPTRARIA